MKFPLTPALDTIPIWRTHDLRSTFDTENAPLLRHDDLHVHQVGRQTQRILSRQKERVLIDPHPRRSELKAVVGRAVDNLVPDYYGFVIEEALGAEIYGVVDFFR